MAMEDPAKKSRDQKLDELLKAHEELHKREMKRIDAEEQFYRSVLKARTGSATLVKANAAASKLLLANDIGSFLTG